MVNSNLLSVAKLVIAIVLFVYGFSGEDAKLIDGEAQRRMPVVCIILKFKTKSWFRDRYFWRTLRCLVMW